MAVQVKLKDIVEGLEFLTDEGTSYLNTTTGEVIYVTTEELRAAEEEQPLEDFPEWQHDAIRIAGEIIPTATLLEHTLLTQGFMGTSKAAFPRRLRLQNRDSTWVNLVSTRK